MTSSFGIKSFTTILKGAARDAVHYNDENLLREIASIIEARKKQKNTNSWKYETIEKFDTDLNPMYYGQHKDDIRRLLLNVHNTAAV